MYLPVFYPVGQALAKEKFHHAVEHLIGHQDSSLKYYIYLTVCFFAFFFLVYLGKALKKPHPSVKSWYPLPVYLFFLLISLAVSGFLLGKSPNPMEGIVKVFKSFAGLYPDPTNKILAFLFFLGLAVIGNKIICGWACPFGALQELIFSIPVFRKIKSKKPPFWLTNSIRALLFILMLLFLYGLIGGKKGFVIYHFINPFNLFNLDFEMLSIIILLGAVFLLSFFYYRPFCQLICPFGFISWIFEHLSIVRVKIDQEKCTGCNACVRVCPTQATKGKVAGHFIKADCFSCTRCLNACPVDAIAYKPFWKK